MYVHVSAPESTSRDLKSAQCRFESDWGHCQGKRAHELVRDGGWMDADFTTVLDLLDDDQISRYHAVAGRGVAQSFRDAREYLAAALGLAGK
jgi:hypothetical protein